MARSTFYPRPTRRPNTFDFDKPKKIRYFLSENQRKRIEEINLELDSIEAEKTKRQLNGRPIDDLDKRREELERQKEELVGEIADIWSS